MTTMTLADLPHPVATPRPRLLTAAVLRLFAVDFAAMSSFYLLLSVVPLYSTDRGIGSAGAGLSTGVLMIAAVIGEIATPVLAARVGYRRLLMGGLILLGAPALALPAVGGLAGLMAVSVVRGSGFAIVVVAVGALAATVIPQERRGEGLGLLGVMAMLPAVLTLPLGVWLVGLVGFPVVFAVAAAAAVLVVPLVAQLPDGVANGHSGIGLGGMRRPAVLRPVVVFATTAVAGGVVVTFLSGAVPASVAVPALFVQSAAATLTRWLAGRYGDRHGAAGLLVPAVVASALGMGAAALTSSSLAVVAGMAVFGVGFGLAQSASLTTMLRRVSRSRYGAVSATWNAAYDLGWGVGSMGIGLVVSGFGYPAAFATAAVLVFAALPLARRSRD